MANKIIQYRYYGDGNNNNYPSNAKAADFAKLGYIKESPILQLGIQTLPGTMFYVNDNQIISPIIIGATGVYELDLDNKIKINSLRFNRESMEIIDSQPGGYLIIDIVYETEEE